MKHLFYFILVFVAVACQTTKINVENTANWNLYKQAVLDAMAPDSSKIDLNLVPINTQNNDLVWKEINGENYLLVVTWKQDITYYQPYLDSAFYNTGNYPIWITTAPELLNRIKEEKYTDVNTRLKQLLGLPPNSVYSYFVEFWVKPSDLFRPCPDREVSDKACSLCFPSNTDSTHIEWINENRISRYYACDLFDKYPWTQLGYTYDWNATNVKHLGLSEFVIAKNSNIVVKQIYTTEQYLNQ